jgi:hypothetical protein
MYDEELQVPIAPYEVEFTISDGSRLEGTIFLSLNSPLHDGPETLDEFFNSSRSFLPVRSAGAFLLLGADSILLAKAPAEAPLLSRLPGRVVANVYLVRLRLDNGIELEGTLSSNLPPELSRASDAFNQPGNFLPIESSEAVYLVRKDRVTRVEI